MFVVWLNVVIFSNPAYNTTTHSETVTPVKSRFSHSEANLTIILGNVSDADLRLSCLSFISRNNQYLTTSTLPWIKKEKR